MAEDRRSWIWIASTVMIIVISLWKTGDALNCYACEKSSEKSYEDAEKLCNIASLGKCDDATSKACMVEGFQRDSAFHVIKRCVQECPVFVNSSAQLIRCCSTDACNDFVVIGSDSDGSNNNILRRPSTEDDVYSRTTSFSISTDALDPPSSSTTSTSSPSAPPFSSFPSPTESPPSHPQPPRPIPPPSSTSRFNPPGSNSSQAPGRNPHQSIGGGRSNHHNNHNHHRSQFDGAGYCRGSRSGTVRHHRVSGDVLILCSMTALLVWWSHW